MQVAACPRVLCRRLLRVWTDPRVLGWTAYVLTLTPLLLAMKLRRFYRKRAEWELDPTRWWVPPFTPSLTRTLRPPHVVFVGAGIGELQIIDRVADALRAAEPQISVSYCLRDPSILQRLREERPTLNLSIWPFDFLFPVSRWLAAQRPDVVVFTERFRFTTFANATARYGAKVALMNGRSRRRDSNLYRLVAPFYRWQFGAFSAMAMQSDEETEAARPFMPSDRPVVTTGNLKADLVPHALDTDTDHAFQSWLDACASLPLLVAGSTEREEEERTVLESFRQARERGPCRLILAPRRPTRSTEVQEIVQAAGFTCGLRSNGDAHEDVIVLDTFGELARVYGGGCAAYVGGALGVGNGHNVLEPIERGVPVAYGMNRGHFEVLQKICEAYGVGYRVAGVEELAHFWNRYLQDPQARQEASEACRRLIKAERGATERTIEVLLPLVEQAKRQMLEWRKA